MGASATYGAGLFPMRSPLENLISNEAYWASERVEGDLARIIPDVRRWQNTPYYRLNSCFFDSMTKQQLIHGYRKQGL